MFQKRKILTFLLLILPFLLTAQMNISFPMEKAVFQRNNTNQATIYIAGSYTNTNIDKIEAQLIPVSGGVPIAWTVIQNSPQKGSYYGSLTANAGWYTLSVQGKSGNTVLETATLSRVGVGEVFIIAGQSNAEGYPNYGSIGFDLDGSPDERVVTHNYDGLHDQPGAECSVLYPPYPVLSSITSHATISKYGYDAWCYYMLGKSIANNQNVPVAFYNAGANGSSSLNWKESSDGLPTIHPHTELGVYCGIAGSPYSVLKICLNYYASMFGARAILWHQGESDQGNTAAIYTSNMNYVIAKARADFENTIPWVISRVSYNPYGINGFPYTDANVIAGQNNVIAFGPQTFAGPETDAIVPRDNGGGDGLHFYGSSQVDLANAWSSSLNNTFFANSAPIPAKPLPYVQITCAFGNKVNLIAPSGYSSYKWVHDGENIEDATFSSSQTLTVGSDIYRCWLKSGNNYVVTQAVNAGNALGSCSNPTSCTGITYLSSLNELGTPLNGFGPFEKNRSNGGDQPGDGGTITLNGTTYAKGLGTHANSEIVYDLTDGSGNTLYSRFITDIGIDDEVPDGSCGTVIFKVYKDNVLAFTSPVMTSTSTTQKINLDVRGTSQLKIVVNDAGDNFFCDHADWAGARLHCIDTEVPSPPTSLATSFVGMKCVQLNWTGSTDNMEVLKYNVYANNILVDFVYAPSTSIYLSNLSPGTVFNITVKAEDYSGNISQFGANATITTINDIIVTSNKNIVNVGQTVNLSATGCGIGSLTWFNGVTATSQVVSPTTTKTYKAICRYNFCNSDSIGVTIQVLNCTPTYTLSSPTNDLQNGYTLKYEASNNIVASNLVKSGSNIKYDAAKSVILSPGFKVESGAIFTAYIDGCGNLRRSAEDTIPEEISTPKQPIDFPKKITVPRKN